jgi:hypothetical protein
LLSLAGFAVWDLLNSALGQALWSAIHEHERTHAEIIEVLISGGAKIHPGTLEWWEQQDVPSSETKERVTTALRRRALRQ